MRGVYRHIFVWLPKQEQGMNTKFVHESRELTADELNTVSGGKGKEPENQDRLGNFEIQTLMSNLRETSSVQK